MASSGTYTMTPKTGTPSGSARAANPAVAKGLSIPTKCWDFGAWRAFDAGGPVDYGAAASNDG
jgi:hypothetical protein